MSWSRILRFAKERQVPVIVTDESGEEPMILLSLDALEQALDGGTNPVIPPPPVVPRPSATPSFVPEPVPEPPPAPVEMVEPEPVVSEPVIQADPVIHAPEHFPTQDEVGPIPSVSGMGEPSSEPSAPIVEVATPQSETAKDADIPSALVPGAETEPAAALEVSIQPDIKVMTPPVPEPEKDPPVAYPPQSPADKPPLPSGGISLEERFFLDF